MLQILGFVTRSSHAIKKGGDGETIPTQQALSRLAGQPGGDSWLLMRIRRLLTRLL